MDPELKILTAEEIWAAKDIEERIVPVPQWGGAVRIRTLSQKQSGDLRRKAQRVNPVTKQSEIDNEALEQLLFIEGVIEPKFDITDYGRLSEKSMAAVTSVLKAIMDASGFSGESVNEATKSAVEGSVPALRVLPGLEAGDDESGVDYRMSGNEFAHWVAYFILERRDEERAQRQARNRQQALQMSRNSRGG